MSATTRSMPAMRRTRPSCTRWLRFVALALLAAAGAARAAEAGLHGAAAQRLLQQTNTLRATAGLAALAPDARLNAAAARFARYMAEHERFGHEADGRQPHERASAQGYEHCLLTENVGYASSTRGFDAQGLAARVFDGWARSPAHRHNMLDADATQVGIALAQGARSGRHYAVQMLARPRSQAVRIVLANRSRVLVRYELGGERYELEPGVTRTHDGCRRALLGLRASELDVPSATPILTVPGARYRIEDAAQGIRVRRE